GGEKVADSSGRRFSRISCAHHLAQPGDGIVAFQHHYQRRAGTHEFRQALEERLAAMDLVEALRFALCELDKARGDDSKLSCFENFDDVADVVPLNGVGLDDA